MATVLPVLPWKTVNTILALLWQQVGVHVDVDVDVASSITTWDQLAGLVVNATG